MARSFSRRRERSKLTKVLIGVGAALLVLAAVLLVNTWRYRPAPVPVVEGTPMALDAQAAADRLAGALGLRTVSHEDAAAWDTSAFRALHAYLAETFPGVDSTLRRDSVSALSLLYTWPGRDTTLAPVVLMAHLDVVPVDGEADNSWTHPPYAGTVTDGAVWGRGALDDKNGVVGLLEAVEHLLAEGYRPPRTVYLAFGHDEEVGGEQGARQIAAWMERRGIRPAMVVDEGGAIVEGALDGVDVPVALVGVAEKGYVSVELVATSPGGHSSTPPRHTAVGRVSRAVTRLEEQPLEARLDGVSARMFDQIGRYMPFERRVVFANRWLFEPLLTRLLTAEPQTAALVRTTTAATMIEGGVEDNVLPTRARAVVNFRLLPGTTVEDVLAHVRETVDDTTVAVHPLGQQIDPSPTSSSTSEAFRLVEQSLRRASPGDTLVVAPYLVVGATDSRYFAPLSENTYRIAGMTLTPEALDRIHGTDERILIREYARQIETYYHLLKGLDTLE